MSFRSPAAVQFLEGRRLLADAVLPAAQSVLADMNGDGKADLIQVHRSAVASNAVVTIGLGNGAGKFRLSDRALVPANTATALGVGDLDGDGAPDVAVAGNNPLSAAAVEGTYAVAIFGDGAGKFRRIPGGSSTTMPLMYVTFVPEVARARGVSLADLDGNGFGEISVLGGVSSPTTLESRPTLVVQWDPTLPTFAPVPPTVVNFNTLIYLDQLHVADLDEDGRDDLVATHRAPLPPSMLAVIRYDLATVRFPDEHAPAVRVGVNPLNAIPFGWQGNAVPPTETFGVGRLNHDGVPELIGRRGTTLRYASYQEGNTPFGPPQTVVSSTPSPIALRNFRAGDVTGDGLDDVLADSARGPALATNITQAGGPVAVRWSTLSMYRQIEQELDAFSSGGHVF